MQSSSNFSEDTREQQATGMTLSDVALLEGNTTVADPGVLESNPTADGPGAAATGWRGWFAALRCVFPIYLATHLALLILTYCSALFSLGNFSTKSLPLTTLLTSWDRWDSAHFTYIASNGYTTAWRTAFFPSFPLLEHLLAVWTGNPFVAGLIISNVAGLLMLAVFYRLVLEDFDRAQAWNSVLYLA